MNIPIIDSHTHMYAEQFDDDWQSAVDKAIRTGIKTMILPGIDSTYFDAQMKLVKAFPNNCFNAFGLHPSHVKENFLDELACVEKYHAENPAVAVGEIGIDLYWDKTYLPQQIEAFEYQVNLAKKLKLPIIIHVREAFDEVFKSLDKLNDNSLGGIFHSFTGTVEQAEKIVEYGGFKMGINGIVTFKNAELPKTVEKINPKHLVLETDSPWLSPAPKRGKRNESAHLIHIAQKIADLHGLPLEEIAKITNQNAKEIFGEKIFKVS